MDVSMFSDVSKLWNPGGSSSGGWPGGPPVSPGGSNQWMNFPTMPSPTGSAGTNTPGVVPSASGTPPNPAFLTSHSGAPTNFLVGSETSLGSGQHTIPTLDPKFTAQFFSWLQSQLGKGVTPFNLSALLPSGGVTDPGILSAPETDIIKKLQDFFSGKGGGGLPGANELAGMAKTGDPISSLPEFQAMLDAMQRNIGQSAANLKEQFAFGGNLASSPFGTAMSDFFSQTSKDQNALLARMQTAALESAQGRKLGAEEFLGSEEAGFGQYLQGLDQQSIDRLYQEFIRTQPEYNPLLGLEAGAATTFPPSFGGKSGSMLGGIGSLIGAGASGASAGLAAAGGGAGTLASILAGLAAI